MLLLGLLLGLVTGALATRKGYSFIHWMLSMGLIGLVFLAFLPYANKPDRSPEENAALVKRGNTTGLVMSGITLVFVVIQLVSALES